MPTPPSTTLRRVRGCVAGGLSGGTSIVAHGLAGGGESPSATAFTLLVLACAAFGATACTIKTDRGALAPLLAVILAGQAIGHATLMLTAHHGHLGLGLPPGMLAFHAAAAAIDVALIRLTESAAVWALSLLRQLTVLVAGTPHADVPMWVVSPTPVHVAHGLVRASTAVTRGPPAELISH